MYIVRFTNFAYISDCKFEKAHEALEFAESKGFEASVEDEDSGQVIAIYSPIAGIKTNWR